MALSMGLFAKPFIISRVQNHLKYIVASPTLSSSLSFNTKFTSSLSMAAETNSFTKLSDESPPLSGLESVIAGYILGKKKATEVAHAVWTNVVRKGDVVVDATCGNGYDTLAMLRLVADDELQIGHLYAMDLQKDAFESTSSFLDKSVSPHERECVELHAICHSKMGEIVPQGMAVRLVAFNLGYLPGGDKEIKTDPETMLLALEAAKSILAPGGLISIVAYVGHFGGRRSLKPLSLLLVVCLLMSGFAANSKC